MLDCAAASGDVLTPGGDGEDAAGLVPPCGGPMTEETAQTPTWGLASIQNRYIYMQWQAQ